MAAYKHLSLQRDGDTMWATLNRPERLNALNRKLIDELRHFFTDLYWQHEIRVVVLHGAGANFCAGLDLKEHQGKPEPTMVAALVAQRGISEIVIAMRRCPQPIIVLVNGAASGGGLALALAADVRVATPTMRMNAAFIRVGLSGCDIGLSYFLPRIVGSSVASELMLTGRFIDAGRAERLGIVSRIVESEALQSEAEAFVEDMLLATPLGLRLTKEALNYAIDAQGLEAVIAMEDRNQVMCAQGEDFAEGVAAFREKRRPRYKSSGSIEGYQGK